MKVWATEGKIPVLLNELKVKCKITESKGLSWEPGIAVVDYKVWKSLKYCEKACVGRMSTSFGEKKLYWGAPRHSNRI